MIPILRRAKSFIDRPKEDNKRIELDLAESSHLRRSVTINNEVIQQQKHINTSREQLSTVSKKVPREQQKSEENIHDKVIAQLKALNFGDSHDDVLIRRHPTHQISNRRVHRRSFCAEDNNVRVKQDRGEKHVYHRKSGDVISDFNRTNPIYSSERISIKPERRLAIGSDDNLVNPDQREKYMNHRRSDGCFSNLNRGNVIKSPEHRLPIYTGNETSSAGDDLSESVIIGNFNRLNLLYCSERLPVYRPRINTNDDFLVNRRAVDSIGNFHPAYRPDIGIRRQKSDLSGFKNILHKLKVTKKPKKKPTKEPSEASSSGCSTGSSICNSNTSTTSSSASTQFDRQNRSCSSDRHLGDRLNQVLSKQRFDPFDKSYYQSVDNNHQSGNDEVSRKRSHNQTKPKMDRKNNHNIHINTGVGESGKPNNIKRDSENR